MKKFVIIISVLFGVTACTTSPTLQEKIAGKSAEERTAIVKQECLDEANRLKNSPKNQRASSHAKKVREICETILSVR